MGAHAAPSLQAICTSQLCSYVVSGGEAVLEAVRPWLSVLPLATRLELLAAYRHSCEAGLEPSLLAALCRDAAWLDGGPAFADEAAAQCGGPGLIALDIRRSSQLSPRGLVTLLLASPNLITLRCGGCPASNAAARVAVRALLPRAQGEDDVPESWELAGAFGGSLCPHLRWLVWPEAGDAAMQRLARCCPRIALIGLAPHHHALPLEAQLSRPLDADVVAELERFVALPARPALAPPGADTVHISTLFRCAYEARDERLAPKRLRNARRAARLAALASSERSPLSSASLRRIGALCHTED